MEQYRDVSVKNGGKFVRYYHYEQGGVRYYLFSNEDTARPYETIVRMRGFDGGDYTVYDPFENKAVRRHSENGSIQLTLTPYNLICVVIGDNTECGDGSFVFEQKSEGSELISPIWEISVCEEKNLPSYRHYKTTAELESITGAEALYNFSGNIRYTATVKLDAEKGTLLDLGEVGSTAEVKLNGKPVGVRVYPPYRFDLSDAAVSGDNALEITVTNTCVFAQHDNFSRYLPIRASGLMGPVSLTVFKK